MSDGVPAASVESSVSGGGASAEANEGGPENGADEHRSRVAPWIAMGIAIVMIGLFVVLIGADTERGQDAESPLIGRPAPEATGELLDGTNFDLSQRKGSWVILNFFRADCVPCVQEHPDLVAFNEQQAELGSDRAEFYSIVVDDTRDDVEAFFDEEGGDWPVVLDHQLIDVAFGVALVPETWFIDSRGIVRGRIISRVSTERLNIALQELRERYGA